MPRPQNLLSLKKIKTCCFRASLVLFSCLLLGLFKNKSHVALKQVGNIQKTITLHNLECKGRLYYWCCWCYLLLLLLVYSFPFICIFSNLFCFENSFFFKAYKFLRLVLNRELLLRYPVSKTTHIYLVCVCESDPDPPHAYFYLPDRFNRFRLS